MQEVPDFSLHFAQPRAICSIHLGQRYRAARNSEQLQDRHMLASLRHHAIVGGHHQQGEVDAASACNHGVHEPLVAMPVRMGLAGRM